MRVASGHVLIVENDLALAQAIESAAHRAGLRTQLTPTAQQALAAAVGPAPAVVVIDLGVPESYGTNLAMALRATWPAARLLLLSDLSEDATAKAAYTLQAIAALTKPVDVEALQRALQHVASVAAATPSPA